MSLTAYIRYDHTGRIVPGGPIVVKDKPAVGNWQVVTEGTNVTLSGKLRAFVKVDRFGKPIASSLFLGKKQPATGDWIEVNASLAQSGPTPSTSTTTTSTTVVPISTTTTTTTTSNVSSRYGAYAQAPNTQWIYKDVASGKYIGNIYSQFSYYFEGATPTIGTRLYYDQALTQPVELSFDGTLWFILGVTQFNVNDLPENQVIYTVNRYGYITDMNLIINSIAYRNYYGLGTNGGNWYYTQQYQPFTSNCSEYFNTAYTDPGVDTITIGTTVYSTLSSPYHSPEYGYLSYNGNIYQVAENGIVTSLVTNCGGTTTTTTTTIAPYVIGQQALGGTIAYVLQPGDPGYDSNVQHGLVATVNDVSTSIQWGCAGTFITDASGTAIGTGLANTTSIVNQCGENGAAKLCFDLVEGGYSDWYLPSKDELSKLWINREAIGNFGTFFYFTSSQTNANDTWVQQFSTGSQFDTGGKQGSYLVRAIRSF